MFVNYSITPIGSLLGSLVFFTLLVLRPDDQLSLVSLINHYVPTEMEVDAGTVVLALVLDTLSGRSPLYRLEEFFAQQDTELLGVSHLLHMACFTGLCGS